MGVSAPIFVSHYPSLVRVIRDNTRIPDSINLHKPNPPELHNLSQLLFHRRFADTVIARLSRFPASILEEGAVGIGTHPADKKLDIHGSKDPEYHEKDEIADI